MVATKVNGIVINSARIRRKLIDGTPIGDPELVIDDPVLGSFAVDDNEGLEPGLSTFFFEVKKNRTWTVVTVKELLSILLEDTKSNYQPPQ